MYPHEHGAVGVPCATLRKFRAVHPVPESISNVPDRRTVVELYSELGRSARYGVVDERRSDNEVILPYKETVE